MRVIFLALAFPNMALSKYLYTELVTQLNENGHDIIVIAPAYNKDIIGLQIEGGIKVIRVPTFKLFRVGLIQKGIANILLPYQYKKALIKSGIDLKFDLIIIPTPPITLYNVVTWLLKKSKAKVYLILRDIFPQNAVDLGMMKENDLIHGYFRRIEKKLYNIAYSIGCMSEGNISFIKKHNPGIDHTKLHLLPNWADLLPLQQENETIELKKKEGLVDKFIVIFGGNIGRPQKMENIVELAEKCTDVPDILFLIFGYGSELENIKKFIADKNLHNIQLRDGVPHSQFFKILQIADVGLISLNENFTIPNIPSKALSYYNAKKPILASIDINTDFGQILATTNTGFWAEAGKTGELKEKLLLLYNNPNLRKQMGENGYLYMKEQLNSKKAYKTLMDNINKI